MARELGDVLHFFLDDVPPKSTPTDREWLGPALARLEPPLRLEEELKALPPELSGEQCASLLARDPEGRGVLVLVSEAGPAGADCLALGLAQLDWLGRRHPGPAHEEGADPHEPQLLLVAERFAPPLERAAAHLEPRAPGLRLRLVRTFPRASG